MIFVQWWHLGLVNNKTFIYLQVTIAGNRVWSCVKRIDYSKTRWNMQLSLANKKLRKNCWPGSLRDKRLTALLPAYSK